MTKELTLHEVNGLAMIAINGYGEKGVPDGFGQPIVIDLTKKDPILYVWADINQEAPTHRISLAGAAESLRGDDAPGRTKWFADSGAERVVNVESAK